MFCSRYPGYHFLETFPAVAHDHPLGPDEGGLSSGMAEVHFLVPSMCTNLCTDFLDFFISENNFLGNTSLYNVYKI